MRLPFEPPDVNVPSPFWYPANLAIKLTISCSISVATGAISNVYIEVFVSAEMNSPTSEDAGGPPQNGFMKWG